MENISGLLPFRSDLPASQAVIWWYWKYFTYHRDKPRMKGMFEVLGTILRKLLEKTQVLSIIPRRPSLKPGNHFSSNLSLTFLDIKISHYNEHFLNQSSLVKWVQKSIPKPNPHKPRKAEHMIFGRNKQRFIHSFIHSVFIHVPHCARH